MFCEKDYLNKKIKVKVKDKYSEDYVYVVGICTYIGFNQILNHYQITISRLPIWPITEEQLQIMPS